MGQLGKCLLSKHESPSLIPQNPHKKPGVVAHIYNPDAKKAGTEGSLASCSPACLRKFRANKTLYIKQKADIRMSEVVL